MLGLPNVIEDPHKKPQRPHEPSTTTQRVEYRDYREKKAAERERLEREKQQHHAKPGVPPVSKHLPPGAQPSKPPHTHHRPPPGVDPKHQQKLHHRPSGSREQLAEQTRDPSTSIPNPVNRDYMRETNGRDNREGLVVHRERDHREVINRDVHRDQNKDLQKHNVKPDLKVDSEFSIKVENVDKQRYDTNRQKLVDPKLLAKHDPNRHKYPKRPEIVPNISENKKPVPNQSAQENKNSFINKQTNSTSQRHKSPFSDAPKSVPLLQTPTSYPVKSETRNGNHNLNLLPTIKVEKDQWPESTVPDDPGLLSPISKQRQPSLFSPEKTTPPKKNSSTKTPPTAKKNSDSQLPNSTIPTSVSPFNSPPPKLTAPGLFNKRHRSSSSSSEPELRPVVRKLDQISGFENIIRDSKVGIKLPKVPDIIQPICDRSNELPTETSISKELKPPDIIKPFNNSSTDVKSLSQPLVNGIETDPTLISNLLKEVPTSLNHLPVIKSETPSSPEYHHLPVPQAVVPAPIIAPLIVPKIEDAPVEKHKSEHHHKSEKKKKKDKHKHKDKEKSKEEKEKKKKHKDKDKEKHKSKADKTEESVQQIEAPLKITIPKDKIIQPPPEPQLTGLKVKISKDRLKTDSIENTGSLKLKISKDMIQYNSITDGTRKREREKTSPIPGPPAKAAKTNYTRNPDTRQNGRNSYSKVSYNNNNRGRYCNNMPPRMPPPQLFQPNQPPPFYVPNYPPPNVQMAQAWYPHPPEALYHHQFYGFQMYPPPDMYSVPPQPPDNYQIQPSNNNPPPLPEGPPPNTPPPPPPE